MDRTNIQGVKLSPQQAQEMAAKYMRMIMDPAVPMPQKGEAMMALQALAQQNGPAINAALQPYGFSVQGQGQIVSRDGKPIAASVTGSRPSQLPPPGFGGGGPAVSSNPTATPPLPRIQGAGFDPRAAYTEPTSDGGGGGSPIGTDTGASVYAPGYNSGDPMGASAGVPGALSFDEAMMQQGLENAPGDAYFKGAQGSTLGEVTPSFMQGAEANDPAWKYYLAKSGLRDTHMADSGQDDFMAAEMMQRLLGEGDIMGRINPVDQLYGTQQLMGQLSEGGNFVNPQAMMDAMFEKVANIEDPNMQMTYINGALSAMKPYMSATDYANLQSMVSRQAENFLVQGIDQPTADKDFLSLLQGIR